MFYFWFDNQSFFNHWGPIHVKLLSHKPLNWMLYSGLVTLIGLHMIVCLFVIAFEIKSVQLKHVTVMYCIMLILLGLQAKMKVKHERMKYSYDYKHTSTHTCTTWLALSLSLSLSLAHSLTFSGPEMQGSWRLRKDLAAGFPCRFWLLHLKQEGRNSKINNFNSSSYAKWIRTAKPLQFLKPPPRHQQNHKQQLHHHRNHHKWQQQQQKATITMKANLKLFSLVVDVGRYKSKLENFVRTNDFIWRCRSQLG